MAPTLLPTPTETDSRGGRNRTSGRSDPGSAHHDGVTLCDAVQLLPTPQAREGDPVRGAPSPEVAAGRLASGRRNLDDAVALLPTPMARDGASGPGHAATAQGSPDLRTVVPTLLPTPDAGHGRKQTRTGPLLAGAVELLPTPRAADGPHGGPGQTSPGEGRAGAAVRAVQGGRWGRYAAAIARWEAVTGHPAPEPTVPGGKGQPVLNPRLSEWLMGLPPGYLDVPGVSASAQKAMAGNGVVPQQAELALRILLGVDVDRRPGAATKEARG